MMTENPKLDWLLELIQHSSGISGWLYSPTGECLETNDSNALLLERIFAYTSCRDAMVDHFKRHRTPLLLSAPLGTQWAAVAEGRQGAVKRLYVLGPVLSSSISPQNIKSRFASFSPELSAFWGRELDSIVALFGSLRVVSSQELQRLAILLHDCVNQEAVSEDQIRRQNCSQGLETVFLDEEGGGSLVWDWEGEQKLLLMVREGNLAYRQQLAGSSLFEQLWQPSPFSSLRQAKISAVSFIALCTHTAIEGGLLPDTAYGLSEYYIRNAVGCQSGTEVVLVIQTMYHDLIQRVAKHKQNRALSKPIQDCCSYIEQHVEDVLTVSALAKQFGYAQYYFTQKFKQETGENLRDYIQRVKIQRAKYLLKNSNISIQQISDSLHYSSRNYFYVVFRKAVGVPPAAYRAKGDGGQENAFRSCAGGHECAIV